MPTLKPPLTSQEIHDSWIEAFRDAAQRVEYRAGPLQPTIEVKSPTRGFMPVMLPNGSNLFASAAERDAVLARIRG